MNTDHSHGLALGELLRLISSRLASLLANPARVFRGYERRFLIADLLAGITVAAFAIPQSIAYATIAELPPHYGLYAAAVSALVASLWRSSRFVSTGPTNAVSLLSLSVLLPVASPGTSEYLLAASTLAILAGVLLVTMALLHLGAVVTLASRSVLLGFAAGAAVLIAAGQLRHLLNISVPPTPELNRMLAAIYEHVGDAHVLSLAVGLGALALLLILRALNRKLPSGLIVIIASVIAVRTLALESHGIRVVGDMPQSLPPLTYLELDALPDLEMFRTLFLGALAVAALGLVEAVATGQKLAKQSGDRLDNNQEFFAQGLGNIAAGLFSGYACSGSFTRSELNAQAGARTALSGAFSGAVILVGVLVLAPYARLIPRAALAGVLLFVAWKMIDRAAISRVVRTSRTEAAILVTTFGATLILPLELAVLVGVLLSLVLFIIQASLPRVHAVVPDPTYRHMVDATGSPSCPQLGIVNIHGPLFFGAVHHLEEEFAQLRAEHPGQTFLLLRMHGVESCDLTGIEMLEDLVKRYRSQGGDLFLVRPRRPVLEMLRNSGFLGQVLGEDHILPQEGAIEYLFHERLDPAVCIYECEHRVFAECQALTKHLYGEKVPACAAVKLPEARRLEAREAHDRMTEGADFLLLDVREPSEWAAGHIPNSRLIPLRELLDAAPELPEDRDLLLICRSGRRSSRAITMLAELGFTRLYGLGGGILAWRAEGLPIACDVGADESDPDGSAQPGASSGE